MSQAEIQELELSIKRAQDMVDMGKALERLQKNKDFKKIVLEGYFEKEAIRLVHLKSDAQMQTPEKQAAVIRGIDAIGEFHDYLKTVYQLANMAQHAIEADEQTRDELLAEELE